VEDPAKPAVFRGCGGNFGCKRWTGDRVTGQETPSTAQRLRGAGFVSNASTELLQRVLGEPEHPALRGPGCGQVRSTP